MAQKLLKAKPRKIAPEKKSVEETKKVVLVGTYKGRQLERWPGYYNYPLGEDDDFSQKERKAVGSRVPRDRVGREVAPRPPQSAESVGRDVPIAPLARVNELWLFQGAKAGRFYSAEFVGIFTREELKEKFGYPATGKAHGERYALYKTSETEIYNPASGLAEAVIVRAADFAKRSPKIAKQIKAYLESPERNDPVAAKLVPKILTEVPRETLRVCEAAVQLELCHMMSAYSEPFCRYIIGNDIAPLFLCGDALAILRELPSESVDCCMTSPPYWNKRQYAGGGIGLESDFHAFIDNLLDIFAEVKRVLKPSGSFWLNIGDSYLDKNLLNVPSRVAIRMQDEQGWILRNTVIWNKVKGCPDNSEDKLRNIYEPIYHFVKRAKGYYYDVDSVRRKPHQAKVVNGAVVSATGVSGVRYKRQIELSTELTAEQKSNALAALGEMLLKVQNGDVSDFRMIIKGSQRTTHSDSECVSGRARELHEKGFYFLKYNPKGAKPSDLWDIIPEDTQGRVMHFAPYPEDLCKTPLLLTCPLNGIVLDPFSGTGTTAVVAMALGRKSVGIDISSAYIEEAKKRIRNRFIQLELNLQEKVHE